MTQVMITVTKGYEEGSVRVGMETETGDAILGLLSAKEIEMLIALLRNPVAQLHGAWELETPETAIFVRKD